MQISVHICVYGTSLEFVGVGVAAGRWLYSSWVRGLIRCLAASVSGHSYADQDNQVEGDDDQKSERVCVHISPK